MNEIAELTDDELSAVFGGADPDPADTQYRLGVAQDHEQAGRLGTAKALRDSIPMGDQASEIVKRGAAQGRPWADAFKSVKTDQMRDYVASGLNQENLVPQY
jgi:hypothetical protein